MECGGGGWGSELKITPERIYHLEFHPRRDKPLLFASDKVGNFGILNCTDDNNDDDGSEEEQQPDITQFKPHARAITGFLIPPQHPEHLYTASYDSSIRRLDLTTGKSVEIYVHPSEYAFAALSALDTACHSLLFSTLEGQVGRYDTRAGGEAQTWTCSEKKVGGCHVFPGDRNFFATASLDRTVKVWDLRNMVDPVASHSSRLSVSSAMWSRTGKLATTSYDDTVKIYTPRLVKEEEEEGDGGDPEEVETTMLPDVTIPHNNQTGRWLTILRAVWQEEPEDGVEKLVVANMNRGVDVFGADGVQLAQLSDQLVTAVPAVARMHPTRNWVAGGTGSGKIVLYM